MTHSPEIARALEAAAVAMDPDGYRAYPVARRRQAAAAITAFLDALPETLRLDTGRGTEVHIPYDWMQALAQTVERAAEAPKGGRDG